MASEYYMTANITRDCQTFNDTNASLLKTNHPQRYIELETYITAVHMHLPNKSLTSFCFSTCTTLECLWLSRTNMR